MHSRINMMVSIALALIMLLVILALSRAYPGIDIAIWVVLYLALWFISFTLTKTYTARLFKEE